MRTTILLPDALAEAAKDLAATQGRTFTSLVEEGLRVVLGRAHDEYVAAEPLPAHGDPDGRFLLDLDDRDALWAALDDVAEAPDP